MLSHLPVLAIDELYLCGIVKAIDKGNASVSVDVKSESCRGLRKFKLLEAKEVPSLNVNERRCFVIDRNQCEDGAIYTIIKIMKKD